MAWTIVIAPLCFMLFKLDLLKHLALIHPKAHSLTLAVALLISLYAKPTLIKQPALRWLREPEPKKAIPDEKKPKKDATSSD